MRKTLGLAVIPFLYSCGLLSLSYPFIGGTDGWSRWQTALILSDGVNLPAWYWSDIFPPLMSLLMACSKLISGEFGYFTFMQIFCVTFALSLLIWKALPEDRRPRKWIAHSLCLTLLLANPLILNRLAQVYPEPLLAVGLLLLGVLIYKGGQLKGTTFLALSFLAILLTIGLRYNAAALTIPVLLYVSARIAKAPRPVIRVAIFTTFMLISSLVVYRLPAILGMKQSHNVSYILVWDYVGTVMNTPEPEQAYRLNDILPYREAAVVYDPRSNDSLQWGPRKIPPSRLETHGGKVRGEFIRLVTRHPLAFAQLRLERLLNLLTLKDLTGLDGPYEAPVYSDWGTGGPVDINFDPVFPAFREWLVKLYSLDGHHWLYKPPFVIGTALLLVLLLKWLRRPTRLEWSLAVVAVLYYLTFAIITPKVTFRFFFPSYLILTTVSWLTVAKLALHFLDQPKETKR